MRKLFCLTTILLTCRICNAQNFVNASLENWGSNSICDTNSAPDYWTNYSNGGLGPDEVNFIVCPTIIPSSASNGFIYSRMYSGTDSTGEGMYQNVSGLSIGNTYQITFDYAGTSYISTSLGQIQYHLFIDDVDVNQTPAFQATDATWTAHAFNFTASSTTHKIGVRLYRLSGSGTGAIDNFNLNSITGVPNIVSESQIQISPNPFNDKLNIKINDNLTYSFSVFDCSGRPLLNCKLSTSLTIDTDKFTKGIYFYVLRDAHGIIQRGKLVKE